MSCSLGQVCISKGRGRTTSCTCSTRQNGQWRMGKSTPPALSLSSHGESNLWHKQPLLSSGECRHLSVTRHKHQQMLRYSCKWKRPVQKSPEDTVTGRDDNATCSPIQMPWRSTAPSHPSPPLPHERAVLAAGWAQGCSCTQGATSAERTRCCSLERKREGMEGRTGKGSASEQGGEKTKTKRKLQAPFVSSRFLLQL